jgi:glycosyltransferase involved in cell wall biosynthesis
MAGELPDVAFVADNLEAGGAERQLTYMVRVLRERGARVHVYTLVPEGTFAAEIRARGAGVSSIGASGTSHLTRLARLVRAGRAFRPGVVQSAHFHTNLYAAAAGRLLRVPSIGAVRSSLRLSVDRLGRFGRLSIRAPTVVAANSRAAVEEAGALGLDPSRFVVLRNVVDTDAFSPAPVTSGTGAFTVCWVGNANPLKRHDLVVEAFARAFSGDPDAQLVIHGRGGLRPEIQVELARQGVNGQAEIVTPGHPASTLRRADALVLASDAEGTPNVVLEAMACGVPVVATAVGDVPELLRGGCGMVVSPGDVDGLARALASLRHDRERRLVMGGIARRRAEQFDLPGLADNLRRLYRQAGVREHGS